MAGVRTLIAPPGMTGIPVIGASGATYTPDANGMIPNVPSGDIIALLAAGYEIGVAQPGMLTQFGGAALAVAMGAFAEEGNLYRAIGNPFNQNAADTTDDIAAGIVIPAGTFDVSGRGLCITAQGMTGATANNKRMKLWLNPTMAGQAVTGGVISGGTVSGVGSGVLLLDSGVTTINAKGWCLTGNLFKYGAAGSNTQYFQGSTILDATHGGILAAIFATMTESALMNLVLTVASPTTGAAGDVKVNFFEANAMN